jgi:hypothetical protein
MRGEILFKKFFHAKLLFVSSKRPQHRHRGIALLTAVMFALVMSVVARAVIALNTGAASQQAIYEKRARQAARSGLEYARSQLARDADWKGDDPRGRTVDTASLVVEERDGNVVGKLSFSDGGKAQFRLRFNGQDGAGGFDGRENPESSFWIDHKLLSINNLGESSERDEPEIDDSFAVVPDTACGQVPAHAVLLQVEGRAGPGLDALGQTLNGQPSGYLSTAQLGSVMKLAVEQQAGPAVLQAGGTVVVKSENPVLVGSTESDGPSLRTKQTMAIEDLVGGTGTLTMEDGDVYTADGALSANYDSAEITVHEEDAAADFMELTWDQVAKPDPEHSVDLKAGVYVLWPPDTTGGSGTNDPPPSGATLHYYDMSYNQYMMEIHAPYVMLGQLPPNEGEIVSQDFSGQRGGDQSAGPPTNGISIDGGQISIVADVAVTESDLGNTDFAIRPLNDVQMSAGDPPPGSTIGGGNSQEPLVLNIDNSRVYTQGRMIVQGGQVNAEGATLIGESGLIFNAPELTVTGDEQNLSLYFKGDILLSSFRGGSSDYGDFDITGTVYTWGGITAGMAGFGAPGGDLRFQGNMVAFGGEPGANSPGTSGGNVLLAVSSAELIYDPTSVAQVVDPETMGEQVTLSSLSVWTR